MTDRVLSSLSPFAGMSLPSARAGSAAVTAVERTGLGIATLKTRPGQTAALAEALRSAYGIAPVLGPKAATSGPLTVVGTGPGSWLVFQEAGGWRFARDLAARVAGLASVCDQSSGYGVLRIGGEATRGVLAKGVPIDLHPSAFAPGDAAVTLAAHIGIVLWQVDAAPTFDIAVPRSFAGSFAHWLDASAAAFDSASKH